MTTQTALYRHFDASDRLLYVGISLSAINRLKQHTADKEWAANITKVTVEQFATREEALSAERSAIIAEKPIWNIIHNRRTVKPRNLWQEAFESLDAAGALSTFNSDENADTIYEARRYSNRTKFLKENPTFTVIE